MMRLETGEICCLSDSVTQHVMVPVKICTTGKGLRVRCVCVCSVSSPQLRQNKVCFPGILKNIPNYRFHMSTCLASVLS